MVNRSCESWSAPKLDKACGKSSKASPPEILKELISAGYSLDPEQQLVSIIHHFFGGTIGGPEGARYRFWEIQDQLGARPRALPENGTGPIISYCA